MIFLHAILGIGLGLWLGDFWLWVFACQIADIDHLYVFFVRHKLHKKPFKQLIDALLHEAKYNIQSRTPLLHSFLGLFIFSGIASLFSLHAGKVVALGYLSHLLLDLPDIDKKQYFYPLKYTFTGFARVWSPTERVITVISLLGLVILFI